MQLFYAPDLTTPRYTLGEEESKHCIRVLRLRRGDTLHLTDGRGTLYRCEITEEDARRCTVRVVERFPDYERMPYRLTMAVAPTKNIERFEWFLEKATEVGVSEIVPLLCERSERRALKIERAERVVVSAMKQSLKVFCPALRPLTPLADLLAEPFDGRRLIAHCDAPRMEKRHLFDTLRPHENLLVLIGPEGDFSPADIDAALRAGFGMKAGLFPMHVWLPEAHPAAPSHVSALMSGVMIKTGVYGVLRTAMYLPAGETLATAGVILLGAGIVTGLWGVLLAAMQNDIKRLLAYSSIENVGIIFIAIGVALLGRSAGNDAVALCGMAGALLHTLNHSFFKSLLFFGAGNLYAEAHTTALDRFGGVARQMPVTAILFLAGTAAICALPPLNGFVSEFIIYTGMFRSIAEGQQVLLAAAGVTALALIGGLALFAFTKLYGIVFLGAPRTHEVAEMHEADNYRIAAMALPAAGILFIGLLPWTVLPLLTKVAATLLPGLGAGRQPAAELPLWAGLTQITLVAAVLIAATALLLVAKRRALRRRTVASGPTWGCGFTAVNTRMQYTGESFVEGLESIVHPFTEEVVEGKAVDKQEIFPSAHDFDIRRKDRVARLFSAWWVESLRLLNARVMRLRTGKINHYILFALLFIVLVFLCSILNLL